MKRVEWSYSRRAGSSASEHALDKREVGWFKSSLAHQNRQLIPLNRAVAARTDRRGLPGHSRA
jgi:hypothetical protein